VFVLTQLAAGALAGGVLVAYEGFLGRRLPETPFDVVHFALSPWDPDRVAVQAGLIMLHAAVLGLAVFLLRLGAAAWIVPASQRAARAGVLLLWLAGGMAV